MHAGEMEKNNEILSKKLDNLMIIVRSKMEPSGVFDAYLRNIKSKTYVYSPVEADTVDIELAQHLNSLPDSQALSELFIRESEGIYHFGTKRVFIKIENGKVISKFFINNSSSGWWVLGLGGVSGYVWGNRNV